MSTRNDWGNRLKAFGAFLMAGAQILPDHEAGSYRTIATAAGALIIAIGFLLSPVSNTIPAAPAP